MAEAKTKPAAQKAAPAAKPAATKKSTATSAPKTKAPAAPKAAAAKPAAAKKAPTAKKAAAWNPGNEERYNMVQVAAFYLAERDGFAGNPVEYWTAAEIQITSMLPKK